MSGTKQTNNTQFKNPSRIIGIQFGMLSPEEIRKGVVEVVSKDTYINNKEVPGGLFDPRMGVLGHGSVCPTDGLTYINTPGYFGYIELARPVFFIQHIKDIMSILKCVCFKCSKLLISKEDHKHVINMKASDRWSYVYKKCSGISRCGEATELGCGCKQPDKIKLEEMATIIAIWDNLEKTEGVTAEEKLAIIASGKSQFTMRFTAEIVLKIFKRISDEDVNFMGFSPIWSRPDWMVCQVLPVAPPSVRPSVKQDANQRSEDDLTHIYGHIIKTNKDLEERISNNAAPHVIDGLTKVLQYFVAMIANNKVKGAVPMAQRSGRPLQCITDRLNSKNGRIRGNLMGKRVDFSARSVITGDPNLSAKQLGVPKKVAMNLTKPVVVNDRNRNFLTKLVQNGPDVYPGAKNLEKKNGDTISLRYRDRMSIRLENGDVVHRHMMDGDPVLFNRQPSLHRMSMMCHIAKIMDKGDTFRMNVCDTKPYNADFDGDEMNMHMPQNVLSETELRHLAAIPYQIISPSSNAPIIGIYQDSMLGTYRFTRPDIEFSPREAMNILMGFSRVDVASLAGKKKITSFDILSQITPPLTLKTKTKQYDDKADDYATSNNVLEILNGKYVRGQMIASTVKSVLNRVCNDFGHLACSDYIDDLQQVITEYMKTSAYSVGVSDLISDKRTTDEILQVIAAKKAEVQQLTDKIHLGIFENKTGNANSVEYENQVKGILNKATDQTGTIAKKSLDANNRFLIMVASGSKGNMVNISQMISCLGQQSVDGKRVPYGFDNRTLPHFSKYDDSPGARGFVENSYISGLTAPELFFHAMGGRMGLIDTAVKTSQTGYIQRRLVKGLEDLKVEYDMTVRNNMGKIVQFSYGEDGAETTRIENQSIPIVGMSVEQIYMHYDIVGMNEGDHELIKIYTKGAATRIRKQREETQALCKKYIDYMIDVRDELVENVFKFKNEDSVKTPVAFHHLIMNAHGQFGLTGNSTVDITPLEAFHMIEAKFETLKLSSFSKPTKMFEILYFYYLSPKDLLVNKRFNKKMLEILLESIHLNFKKSIVSPGEMVGVIAGQSIGEPTTQMTLNTFHLAGVASKSNVTRGVPRIEEILRLTRNPDKPSVTIYMKPQDQHDKDKATNYCNMIQYTKLIDVVKSVEICFDPNDRATKIHSDAALIDQFYLFDELAQECNETEEGGLMAQQQQRSKWVVRMEIDAESLLEKNITMDDIHFAISTVHGNEVSCIYSDMNSSNLVFRIRINASVLNRNKKKVSTNAYSEALDQSDEIYLLKNFQDTVINNIVLRGVNKIVNVNPRVVKDMVVKEDGKYSRKEAWVLDTTGSNLIDVFGVDFIDFTRTYSNDIREMYDVLGIEAARQNILNEIVDVMEASDAYVNYHHLSILCDRMTVSKDLVPIYRSGILNDDIGPISKSTYEMHTEMFLEASRHGEFDQMRGVSANVMCGQQGYYGTNSFSLLLDMEAVMNMETRDMDRKDVNDRIEELFGNVGKADECSLGRIRIDNNVHNLQVNASGACGDDGYELF
jgi:DNA-directed RNA polymerase II subunit RPB1